MEKVLVLPTGTPREKPCAAAAVVVAGTHIRRATTTGGSRSKFTLRRDTDTCSRSRKWSQAPGNIEDLGTANHAFSRSQAARLGFI